MKNFLGIKIVPLKSCFFFCKPGAAIVPSEVSLWSELIFPTGWHIDLERSILRLPNGLILLFLMKCFLGVGFSGGVAQSVSCNDTLALVDVEMLSAMRDVETAFGDEPRVPKEILGVGVRPRNILRFPNDGVISEVL